MRMRTVIIPYPRDTSYLAEVIDDFLKVCDTVSIQIYKDRYLLKLEYDVEKGIGD